MLPLYNYFIYNQRVVLSWIEQKKYFEKNYKFIVYQ